LCASSAANGPGTETIATFAPPREATAASSVSGARSSGRAPAGAASVSAPTPASRAALASCSVPARTASAKSFAPTPVSWSAPKPSPASVARFAGVPITAAAQPTPGWSSIVRVAAISCTEST
jgi:hypothetical protein